jgi:TRAP-type C4-dicarboxylate transport system substrate-binding protein
MEETKMKKFIALLLALVMVMGMVACGAKEEAAAPAATEAAPAEPEVKTYDKPEVSLKFPEINADAGLVCDMIRRFADNVKAGSNGRIEIEVFGGGQLGNEAETMEMLRLGTVDFIRLNPANMATRGIDIPEYTALGLPFLIQSIEGGLEYLYGEGGKALADQIIEKSEGDVRALYNYILTPARNMYSNVEAKTLADFKNLKIRSETSEIKMDMMNCWASATPLAMSEIYTSLSTGVLDGCENTFASYHDNAWYEEAPYCLKTEHVIGASVFMIGEKAWQKLTADEQVMMVEALKEACDWFQAQQETELAAYIEDLKGLGVTFTECTDKQDWIDACAPLYAKYAVGLEDFIADIQSHK